METSTIISLHTKVILVGNVPTATVGAGLANINAQDAVTHLQSRVIRGCSSSSGAVLESIHRYGGAGYVY